MVKKVLAATTAVSLFSTPSLAGSIGQLTSTNTVTTTGGTRQLTITGNYESQEHTVGVSTSGEGASASASMCSCFTPTLTTTGTGGSTPNAATATYSTNSVTGGTYTNDVRSSFAGVEVTTMSGVFFNY